MDCGLPPNSTPRAHEQSTEYQASKKRRRNPIDDQTIISLATISQARDGLQSTKPRLTNTHKVRMMRALVAAMECELHCLQSKWTQQVPDACTRDTAQRCSLEKYAAKQSDKVHQELQEMFQQQQFLLVSLQTAVLRNSLHSNGRDILRNSTSTFD
ncbi:hypothetical protein PHYSODRAFT_336546 [Phytophthora sojae]|uniref:Uncharacterized protein n=1 Tax=Phytophthora sojae (strain P6497) TaxID=1094619 RepID=G4ZYP6_PHYSP|nr:hypothetical protein PHYSODRAFT_336546 [Phytophthora sojae]EGZ12079.1 hypothetical protein PHYSODRAFT_336546 [Phytophthora sojae]|eukprot:XP_009532412.1 hypothetical protein PHYSODRAFT_336546 [Phytophthora sojae]